MSSPLQRAELERRGFVRLPGLLPEAAVRRMADSLWKSLADNRGILRDEPSTWSSSRPSRLQSLTRADAFAELASPGVLAALDDLFGPGGWQRPSHWGQPLVWLPPVRAVGAAPPVWRVPHKSWHFDVPVWGSRDTFPGVRLFALLEPVESHGGATLAVAGSHRLAQQAAQDAGGPHPLSSAELRRSFMRSSAWMRELLSGGAEPERTVRLVAGPHTERGIELQVVELTGEAGDVFTMDLRLLHAASANCGPRPRVVLGQTILRKGGEAASRGGAAGRGERAAAPLEPASPNDGYPRWGRGTDS